jgi:hypothetical protein
MNMTRRLTAILTLVATMTAPAVAEPPASAPVPATSIEYQVKGTVLFNLARFVVWPPARHESPQSPLAIGVWGENVFGKTLEQLVTDATVDRRPVTVRLARSIEDAERCHIVFVNVPSETLSASDLARLGKAGVLTVGEAANFIERGGMIRLLVLNGKVRFEINHMAARRAGIEVSSQLLKLALQVHETTLTEAP